MELCPFHHFSNIEFEVHMCKEFQKKLSLGKCSICLLQWWFLIFSHAQHKELVSHQDFLFHWNTDFRWHMWSFIKPMVWDINISHHGLFYFYFFLQNNQKPVVNYFKGHNTQWSHGCKCIIIKQFFRFLMALHINFPHQRSDHSEARSFFWEAYIV